MDRIKTKFIIAITGRLAAAPDSDAKTELIEELSDNLYSRYQDYLSDGMAEGDAYQRAMDELGDVNELIAYLRTAETNQNASESGSFVDELLHSTEEIVRETISQAKDAAGQAKVIAKDVTRKLKEKYPDGFESNVQFHFDGGQTPAEEDAQRDVIYGFGYDKRKGGFFTQWGEYKPEDHQEGAVTVAGSAAGASQISVELLNGDVVLETQDDPNADVVVEGEVGKLEILLDDSGLLTIRQRQTVSNVFLFGRGVFTSARFQVYLPKKCWEQVKVTATAGDIGIDDHLTAQSLIVRATSGDIQVSHAACGMIELKSASGDIQGEDLTGCVRAESMSGDVALSGDFNSLCLKSASGDIQVEGGVTELVASSVSGDVEAELSCLPAAMVLSSKSGDCRAALPEGQGFSLDFSTVSGDFESELPLTGPIGSKSGRAVYLDGGNCPDAAYQMNTVSGDIVIEAN